MSMLHQRIGFLPAVCSGLCLARVLIVSNTSYLHLSYKQLDSPRHLKLYPPHFHSSYITFAMAEMVYSLLFDENFKEIQISIDQEVKRFKLYRDSYPGTERTYGKSYLMSQKDENKQVNLPKGKPRGRAVQGPPCLATMERSLIRASRPTPTRGPPMSTNDLRHGLYSPSTPTHFGSLSRSATTSRVIGSPKAFGEKTYMNKEDHERERGRWLAKLDEIEARLVESETLNSDMHQIKAELNKKIVDLEKNQRPLIEQNRKVADRNRMLQQEVKKVEQRLCHSQDDYLTLKDAHERLLKENVFLKEKRAYPEKLEELERYRNQVLEYSKCITALRSAGLEKDRRYELLVQKFKRLRKCVKRVDLDDDGRSTVGSDCSAESSVSLDTINEDFEESLNKDIEINYQALYRENAELQRALNCFQDLKLLPHGLTEENHLQDQLNIAQTTIAQQQILIDGNQEMISQAAQLKSVVASQYERIKMLEHQLEEMGQQIAASRNENELLEFQVMELEENSKSEDLKPRGVDKYIDTTETFEDASKELAKIHKDLSVEEVCSLKKRFSELKNASNLKLAQRQVVGQTEGYLDNLEERYNQSNAVVQSKTVEYEAKIKDLMSQVEDSYSKQKKKKELQVEVEELRKKLGEMDSVRESLNEEMRTLSKELSKLRSQLHSKDTELEKEKKLAEGLNKHLQELVQSTQAERESNLHSQTELEQTKKELEEVKTAVETLQKEKEQINEKHAHLSAEYEKFKEEQRPSIRTELERRYEETRYRLNTALEKVQRYELVLESANKKENDHGKLSEALQEDLIQLKGYNEHLERQFQAQTDIIEALKSNIIQQKRLSDFVNKLASCEDLLSLEEELNDIEKMGVDTDMLHNIGRVIQVARQSSLLGAITPLEISTAHHKVRPYNSVDSSGEWHSNSSEGVTSPEEGDNTDWEKAKTLREVKCGGSFSDRSSSAQSN